MIITGVDIETTGLHQEKGARIIEIALLSYDMSTKKLVDSFVQRIDPMCPIDAGAQAVHGIDYNDLIGEPEWKDVVQTVCDKIAGSDLLIAHNVAFDCPFIAAEIARMGLSVPKTDAFCTMENGRWATFDGKLPKLSELCFALDVDYDAETAHAADYDVIVMMDCLFKGINRGAFAIDKL